MNNPDWLLEHIMEIPSLKDVILTLIEAPLFATVATSAYFKLNPEHLRQINRDKKQKIKEQYENAEYVKLERQRINEDIEKYIKTEPALANYRIVNKEYTDLINKLLMVNSKIDKITDTPAGNNMINALLSELKFTVLYKYLEKAEDENIFSPIHLFHIGQFCGMGTDILNAIKETDDTETYKMDQICRKHDLAYLNSRDRHHILKADMSMLGDILDQFTIKGVKQGMINLMFAETLPITEFTNYIITQLSNFVRNPIKTITTELAGKGVLANIVGFRRAIKYFSFDPEISASGIVTDMMFVRERILAILAFGAIGSKILYDISIGKATNTVAGYEDTKFDINEIEYILKEIEAIQNDRLASAGYDEINIADILSRPIEEMEELTQAEIDEPEDPTITEAKNILNSLTEEDEQYILDLMNEYEVGENEIDETNIAEQSNVGEIIL
jgi:hypothetical protein